jgi:hypothetical protein
MMREMSRIFPELPLKQLCLFPILICMGCIVDKEPPLVQITFPPDGSVVGASTNIMVDATDNKGVARVEFYVDGWLAYTDQETPFAFPWVTTAIPDSTTHTLHAKAFDAAKNAAMSNVITLTLSHGNRPPATSTPFGSWGGVVNVACSVFVAVDDPNWDSVAVRLSWGDGDTSDWGPLGPYGRTIGTTHTWSSPDSYFVTAEAMDCKGMTSEWSGRYKVAISDGGPGTFLWRCQGGDPSPAVGPNGVIYITASNSLREVTSEGTPGWTLNLENPHEPPVIGPDGTIYVSCHDYGDYSGALYAIRPNGTVAWSLRKPDSWFTMPALGPSGTIYFGCDSWGDDTLYALSADGTVTWHRKLGDNVMSAPIVGADGTVYVVAEFLDSTWKYYLTAVAPDSSLKWRCRVGEADDHSMAIGGDGTVFIVSDCFGRDTLLYAVGEEGIMKWSIPLSHGIYSSPVVAGDGSVLLGVGDSLWALSPSGTRLWAYNTGGYCSTPAIGSDGRVYVGTWGGLLALDNSGSFAWQWDAGSNYVSSPTVSPDAKILFCTSAGLFAIRGSGRLANSPWPKLYRDLSNTSWAGSGSD